LISTEPRLPQVLELNELQTRAYRFAIRFRAAARRLPTPEELAAQLDVSLVDAETCLRTMTDLGVVPGAGVA
jgi:hypothetical protein